MLPQAVAKLPWGHVRCLLDKLDDPAARLWYAQSVVEHGWSRKVLEHHIATDRYEREGKALTNFSSTLPAPESELVQQIVHEDYNFEFLGRPPEPWWSMSPRSWETSCRRWRRSALECSASSSGTARRSPRPKPTKSPTPIDPAARPSPSAWTSCSASGPSSLVTWMSKDF